MTIQTPTHRERLGLIHLVHEVNAIMARLAPNPTGDVGAVIEENNDVFGSSTGAATGTATGSNKMVTGMFRSREDAENAYNSVTGRGYDKDDVNLLMSDKTRDTHFGDNTPDTEMGSKALEGAGVGSAIGGTIGAVIAGIAAIGTSVLIPGLGLLVAGPLAAALAGAGAGGLTGGLSPPTPAIRHAVPHIKLRLAVHQSCADIAASKQAADLGTAPQVHFKPDGSIL